jgi:hypothetical protein
MFSLAAGKTRVGRALDNMVLRTEGRVTMEAGNQIFLSRRDA